MFSYKIVHIKHYLMALQSILHHNPFGYGRTEISVSVSTYTSDERMQGCQQVNVSDPPVKSKEEQLSNLRAHFQNTSILIRVFMDLNEKYDKYWPTYFSLRTIVMDICSDLQFQFCP